MHFGINELSIKQQFVDCEFLDFDHWKLCRGKSVAMFYEFWGTFHVVIFISHPPARARRTSQSNIIHETVESGWRLLVCRVTIFFARSKQRRATRSSIGAQRLFAFALPGCVLLTVEQVDRFLTGQSRAARRRRRPVRMLRSTFTMMMYVLRTTTDSEFLMSWYAHFYRIFPNEKHHDVDALYKNKRKTPCEFELMMTIMTGVLEIANTKRTESVSKKYAEERGQK